MTTRLIRPWTLKNTQITFKCDKCTIRFTEKRNILRHMKQKHGDTEGTED